METKELHCQVRTGKNNGKTSAGATARYITREAKYAECKDRVMHTESGNMPQWAHDNALAFWDAADEFERKGEKKPGRLFRSVEFSLPLELSHDQHVAIAREVAQNICKDESFPFTFAIHEGTDANGNPNNPHVHLMFNERGNDGLDRMKERWFARADKNNPEWGGAAKSKTTHKKQWLLDTREMVADVLNSHLAQAGVQCRWEHESYAARGIPLTPYTHRGPAPGRIGHNENRWWPRDQDCLSGSQLRNHELQAWELAYQQQQLELERQQRERAAQEFLWNWLIEQSERSSWHRGALHAYDRENDLFDGITAELAYTDGYRWAESELERGTSLEEFLRKARKHPDDYLPSEPKPRQRRSPNPGMGH